MSFNLGVPKSVLIQFFVVVSFIFLKNQFAFRSYGELKVPIMKRT